MWVRPKTCKGINNWWATFRAQSRREGCRKQGIRLVNDLVVNRETGQEWKTSLPRLSTRSIGHRLAPVAPAPPAMRHQLRCLQERKRNTEASFPNGQMFLWLLPPIPLMSELNLEQVSNYRWSIRTENSSAFFKSLHSFFFFPFCIFESCLISQHTLLNTS